MTIPDIVENWIGGRQVAAIDGAELMKLAPASGEAVCRVARSSEGDVNAAVTAAKIAQPAWAAMPPVQRGLLLLEIVNRLKDRQQEMARVVATETGKSFKDAYGETGAAIQQGLFFASEGQRLYGRTTTSAAEAKYSMTVREPMGVAGLIVAANTPIANVAWKVFPALICGNGVVLKAAEDSPITAWLFGCIADEAGLPKGVLNIVNGYGEECGAPLVAHPDVSVLSFTGSTKVGRIIAQAAGQRLAKVSLELGGKNPLIVCDDANLPRAVDWVILSAFSNAGQRCSSGSRVIVFEHVYEEFKHMLVARTLELKVGPEDGDDLGPVINERQLTAMCNEVRSAAEKGATILAGGERMMDPEHRTGFYMAPTLIEGAAPDWRISTEELFGPVTCLYKVKDFAQAIEMANRSPYGLTASIHTLNINRAIRFSNEVRAGSVVINGGTFGSEPHMPFGGVGLSGNGTREPGTEALDIYSNLKAVNVVADPTEV